MCEPAINMYIEGLQYGLGNPSSIHLNGRKLRTKIEEARKDIAKILHVEVGEIFFCSGATEANNTIVEMVAESFNIKAFISSKLEHPSVYQSIIKHSERLGIPVFWIDNDDHGNLDYNQLENLLKSNQNCLVSIMYANNELGNVNDVGRIGNWCRETNNLFHCDAVQAIGKKDLNIEELKIDFISASAHKFYGPKGTGFFYMNSQHLFNPMILGGSQERNMRAGTENEAGIASMSEALKYCTDNMKSFESHYKLLNERMRNGLEDCIHDIQFNGNDEQIGNILNVSFPDHSKADMLINLLDIKGISASSGSACSSGIPRDSQAIRSINHPNNRKAIRFSFSYKNTIDEVNEVIKIIDNIYNG